MSNNRLRPYLELFNPESMDDKIREKINRLNGLDALKREFVDGVEAKRILKEKNGGVLPEAAAEIKDTDIFLSIDEGNEILDVHVIEIDVDSTFKYIDNILEYFDEIPPEHLGRIMRMQFSSEELERAAANLGLEDASKLTNQQKIQIILAHEFEPVDETKRIAGKARILKDFDSVQRRALIEGPNAVVGKWIKTTNGKIYYRVAGNIGINYNDMDAGVMDWIKKHAFNGITPLKNSEGLTGYTQEELAWFIRERIDEVNAKITANPGKFRSGSKVTSGTFISDRVKKRLEFIIVDAPPNSPVKYLIGDWNFHANIINA